MKRSMRLARLGVAMGLLRDSIVLLVFLCPTIAAAQPTQPSEAPPTTLNQLSGQILSILIPAFVTLIGALVTWALHQFSKKTGIEISAGNLEAWSDIARKAVLRASEWARRELKTSSASIPGSQLLEQARTWAGDMGVAMKLPALDPKRLEVLIEAELFNLRREEIGTLPDQTIELIPQRELPRV